MQGWRLLKVQPQTTMKEIGEVETECLNLMIYKRMPMITMQMMMMLLLEWAYLEVEVEKAEV